MSTGGGYVPPPSVGHEIGVMFGFLGAMALSMGLYAVVWNMGQKRSAAKELERRKLLTEKGIGTHLDAPQMSTSA
ncbi:hypothetical protein L228DRAFT_264905 [Xylona heveae TC161]|uniref:Uncharacterized protein n=1 Tax=Xylona heveae (strain CBS 132557 / TC161) TaxID=1328760 RepID=A0A165JQQ5_XYLHT|nr:hypothetical protein L228DRAFT_264905 [Xylona heveae TC161]KZF26519.1 hypothetical protein L228DRAFT_264905 [Xylona heveae TC161]